MCVYGGWSILGEGQKHAANAEQEVKGGGLGKGRERWTSVNVCVDV